MSGPRPDITETTTFLEAAAEARAESRKRWAKGGYWDKKYPQQPTPQSWWPIDGDQPALDNDTGLIFEDRHLHARRVCGTLLATRLDPRFAQALFVAWNLTFVRPPLAESELDRIFDFIARRELRRLAEAA